jgi:hypothetical protein
MKKILIIIGLVMSGFVYSQSKSDATFYLNNGNKLFAVNFSNVDLRILYNKVDSAIILMKYLKANNVKQSFTKQLGYSDNIKYYFIYDKGISFFKISLTKTCLIKINKRKSNTNIFTIEQTINLSNEYYKGIKNIVYKYLYDLEDYNIKREIM